MANDARPKSGWTVTIAASIPVTKEDTVTINVADYAAMLKAVEIANDVRLIELMDYGTIDEANEWRTAWERILADRS